MPGYRLMLFCLRGLRSRTAVWDEKLPQGSFWSLNIGLGLMALLSLLPQGLMQVHAARDAGARLLVRALGRVPAADRLMQTLVWMRMPGDIIFAAAPMLALFVGSSTSARRKRATVRARRRSRGHDGPLMAEGVMDLRAPPGARVLSGPPKPRGRPSVEPAMRTLSKVNETNRPARAAGT